MKNRGFGVVALSFLLACGSDPPPPAAPPPAPTPVASASVAPTPVEKPVEKPVEVYNFGKKAPAAGAKLTDKYTAELKGEEKRVEERKIEVVASEDKTITKAKVTLVSFDHTLKGKTSQPNKAIQGKVLSVEVGKDGKPEVKNDAGKSDAVSKFVANRRPPHVGEPLPGVLAFGERGLKVGDVVEGEKLGLVVSEIAAWHDEAVPMPATAKHELTAKGTLKSVDNGTATFDVTVKEKTTDGTAFALEIDYAGTIAVHMSDSLVSKANLTAKGSIKIKDLAGPKGKINMDLPLESTVTFQRAWE